MARKSKQPRGKKMNPTFFVFCEGKTEAAYIDMIRRSFRIPVEIITRVSDSNISSVYIDGCKRERFTTPSDKTFLMFDLDVEGMLGHLKKIGNVILLLSNPCVEYWFLLHYRDVAREITTAECLALLKKHEADYTKGTFSANMTKNLLGNIKTAIRRSQTKVDYQNPSTTLYRFMNEINDIRELQ